MDPQPEHRYFVRFLVLKGTPWLRPSCSCGWPGVDRSYDVKVGKWRAEAERQASEAAYAHATRKSPRPPEPRKKRPKPAAGLFDVVPFTKVRDRKRKPHA